MSSGICPLLIRCALVMTRLPAAWRNTSVNLTTGTKLQAMMSASTWPGPTDGSWSTSPTMSSAAPSGTARSSERINGTSTMLASSTTRRSQSSGCSSVRRNSPVRGSVSNSRWMVFASSPGSFIGQPLGCPARGRAKRHANLLGNQDPQDGVHQRGLAHAGTAGDHQHLAGEGDPDRLALACGQLQTGPALHPRDRLGSIDGRPSMARPTPESAFVRR